MRLDSDFTDYRSDGILYKTLMSLQSHPGRSKGRLKELHLTRYFTTVELDDDSVGACMSYYGLSDPVLKDVERGLERLLHDDVIAALDRSAMERTVDMFVPVRRERTLLCLSVTASIASALSAPLIAAGGDADFRATDRFRCRWTEGADNALLIGFGGYLEALAREEQIKRLHIVDLLYEQRRDEIDARLAVYRRRIPTKIFSASASLETPDSLSEFDLICVTGSTLCNGTLETILDGARNDARVIVQGQSASIYPRVLFEAGVDWIATTFKPVAVSRMARGDRSGTPLRSLLEGGLPTIFLFPNSQMAGTPRLPILSSG